MQLALITGRTPDLSKKEIEAVATILPFQWSLSMVQADVCILKPENGSDNEESFKTYCGSQENINNLQNRLGGTLKIGVLKASIHESEILPHVREKLKNLAGEGRFTFGISAYGSKLPVERWGLDIKRMLKQAGHSVRFVSPAEGQTLSTAQVLGNKLTKEDAVEVLLVKDGGEWLVGWTLTVQDIESYRKRDRDIPVPDPVSGMLSPKLAQIMLNLGLEGKQATVYDPFCGNGRIIEEARLMGLPSVGSDILEKQVEASRKNLDWLAKEYALTLEKPTNSLIFQQDATKSGAEEYLKNEIEGPWYIVSEPYLGKPLRQPLADSEQSGWLQELEDLYLKFFEVWAQASKKPEGMLIVFPRATCQGGKQLSLYEKIVDRLNKMGYSALQVSDYGRPDALVNRDLVRISFK